MVSLIRHLLINFTSTVKNGRKKMKIVAFLAHGFLSVEKDAVEGLMPLWVGFPIMAWGDWCIRNLEQALSAAKRSSEKSPSGAFLSGA